MLVYYRAPLNGWNIADKALNTNLSINHYMLVGFQGYLNANGRTRSVPTTTNAAARVVSWRTPAQTAGVAAAPSGRSVCTCTTARTDYCAATAGSAAPPTGRPARATNTVVTRTIGVSAQRAPLTGSVCTLLQIPGYPSNPRGCWVWLFYYEFYSWNLQRVYFGDGRVLKVSNIWEVMYAWGNFKSPTNNI